VGVLFSYVFSDTCGFGKLCALMLAEMSITREKLQIVALLIASGVVAVEAPAGLSKLIQLRSESYTAIDHRSEWEKLELYGKVWVPTTVQDIRDYFNYHKDFEVRMLMLQYNREFQLGIPEDIIVARSSYHDLPKVMTLKELKHFGYKGWERSIAEPFLSSLLQVNIEEIRKHLPGDGRYIDIDFSTRLLLTFGISKASFEELFPNEKDQRNIMKELVALPKEINALEDRVNSEMLKNVENILTDRQKKGIQLIEHLADFTSRTQNMLARTEYKKIFIQSSEYLSKDFQVMESLIAKGFSFEGAYEEARKNNDISFVLNKIVDSVGIKFIGELGLLNIIQKTQLLENGYELLLYKETHSMSRIGKLLFSRYSSKGLDFAQENLSLHQTSYLRSCRVAFKGVNVKRSSSKQKKE
jgi:hypothetical protein